MVDRFRGQRLTRSRNRRMHSRFRRAGKSQSRRNALRALHQAGDAAGLNPDGAERVGLHDLRHSPVALAFQSKEPTIPEIAELARHATPNATLTLYAGLSGDSRAKARPNWRTPELADERPRLTSRHPLPFLGDSHSKWRTIRCSLICGTPMRASWRECSCPRLES